MILLCRKTRSKDRSLVSLDSSYRLRGPALPPSITPFPVGAAEGCDLLILKIKRSQPRFTRQLLQVAWSGFAPEHHTIPCRSCRRLRSFDLALQKNKIKRSQPRFTRQLLQRSGFAPEHHTIPRRRCRRLRSLDLALQKNKIKRSQPRFTRQLLQVAWSGFAPEHHTISCRSCRRLRSLDLALQKNKI